MSEVMICIFEDKGLHITLHDALGHGKTHSSMLDFGIGDSTAKEKFFKKYGRGT